MFSLGTTQPSLVQFVSGKVDVWRGKGGKGREDVPQTQEAILATVTTMPWLFSIKLGRNSLIIQ